VEIREDGKSPKIEELEYKAIFETSSIGLALIGIGGEILHANPSFCELLGYSNQEVMNLNLYEITHPQDRPKTEQLYNELMSGQHKSISYEKRYIRKNGSIFWGHPIVSMAHSANKTLLHFVAQVADISERRHAEKELITAHNQLQNIIEFLPDATFVIDNKKNVTAWNRAMEKKTGVCKSEVLGKGDFAYGEALYGERRPILIDLIECPNLELEAQYSYIKRRGETLFAERFMPTMNGGSGGYVWLKASPLYDQDGNLVGAIESIRDITEHKQTEYKLRSAHQKMQDIIDFLPDATFVINSCHEVVAWNKAMEKITGIKKEDMLDQGDYAYSIPFYGERRPILIDMINSPGLIEKYKYDIVENRVDMKCVEQYLPNLYNGRGAYVWATASRLVDKDGNFGGAIESIRDITRRKKAEEDLKQRNRELDAFVHMVSHDLRSPLTPIIGYAQHLRCTHTEHLNEEALDCLQRIVGQGEKMKDLLEDLLTLAKVGYVERPHEPVDLNLLVKEVVNELRSRFANKDITVRWTELPKLCVPKTLLSQLFNNLIGNAIQYAYCDSTPIEIGGKRHNKRIRFYVCDHGPGIAANERTAIFDLFSRGSSCDNAKGSGIGLAIVKKIATLYGGNAWVEETHGGGSTFWVEIVDDRPKG